MGSHVFRHNGPWSPESRQNRALRFVQSYADEICQDLSLPYSPTKYFSPTCDFEDTTRITYHGAIEIKTWMQGLFEPFNKLDFPPRHCIVVDDSDRNGSEPVYTAIAELDGYHWFRGDTEPIVVPRIMIFEIRQSVSDDGYDGLQFTKVKLYWNTSLLKEEKMSRMRSTS